MARKTVEITDEDLLEALDDAVRPIDFEELIREGVIEQDGNWYLILKDLPPHALRKVLHRRMTKKGMKVQFRPPLRVACLAPSLYCRGSGGPNNLKAPGFFGSGLFGKLLIPK
jgi:hypothetical protein